MAELPGTHFGEVLISLGVLDALKLFQILQEQLLLRFEKVLDWRDGRYIVVSNLPDDVSRVNIEETVPQICFRGLIHQYQNRPETPKMSSLLVPVIVGGQKVDLTQLRLAGKEIAL